MTETILPGALDAWRHCIGLPDDGSLQRVADHPRFGEAAQALARNMLAAGEQDKALDGIFKDSGRYGVTFIAVYLHLTGGLTLPRLKAMAGGVLSSPGRARAVLLYLRYLGFIVRGPRREGEAQLFIPTPKCLKAWSGHLAAAVAAAAVLEPEAARVERALGKPQVFAAFARWHSECLLAGMTHPQAFEEPFFKVFMQRHAGNQILWSLLPGESEGRFPPRHVPAVSFNDLARRFGVSRTHVRRMFEAAGRDGILTTHSDGGLNFSTKVQSFLGYLYSAQLMWLLAAAARTVSEVPWL